MGNWYDYNFGGKRVLLVEDHPINAWITQQMLEKVGCQVMIAENGKKGVEQFAESHEGYFDAILMDINMPVMDGWMATTLIRNTEAKGGGRIPIIAMTTNGYDEDIKRSMQAGMNEHLIKPVEPERLFACLSRYLD